MNIKGLLEDIDGMREHQGMSIAELCRLAHISKKTYAHWMSGSTAPTMNALNDVLEALHIELIPWKSTH